MSFTPRNSDVAELVARCGRALQSRLPNEVDWAYKMLLVLAYEGLDVSKAKSLLTEIHVDRGITHFITSDEFGCLLDDDADEDVDDEAVAAGIFRMTGPFYKVRSEVDEEDAALDVLQLRLTQVSQLLRSLSMVKANAKIMATSPLVLNFIIRGAFSENAKYYCRLGVRDGMSAVYAVHRTLHVECVETLRELALALDLTDIQVPLECIRGLLSGLLFSSDRWAVVSALRIYGDLTNIESNREALGDIIGDAELERIAELLLVQEIHVALYGLEAVNQLTEDQSFAERFGYIPGVLDTLMHRLSFALDNFPERKIPGSEDLGTKTQTIFAQHRHFADQSFAKSESILREWFQFWFNPTDDKAKCFSRDDLYRAYQNFQEEAAIVNLTDFGNILRSEFPDLTEFAEGGAGRRVLYLGMESKVQAPDARQVKTALKEREASRRAAAARAREVAIVQKMREAAAPPVELEPAAVEVKEAQDEHVDPVHAQQAPPVTSAPSTHQNGDAPSAAFGMAAVAPEHASAPMETDTPIEPTPTTPAGAAVEAEAMALPPEYSKPTPAVTTAEPSAVDSITNEPAVGSEVTHVMEIVAAGPGPVSETPAAEPQIPQLDGGADNVSGAAPKSTKGKSAASSKQVASKQSIKIRPLSKLSVKIRRPSEEEPAKAPARGVKGKGKVSYVEPEEDDIPDNADADENGGPGDAEKYTCVVPKCGRSFANMNGLNYHVIVGGCRGEIGDKAVDAYDAIPEVKGKILKCLWEGCGKQFNTRRALSEHLGDAHATKSGYRTGCQWEGCPKVGVAVVRRSNLMSHLSTHISNTPFTVSPKVAEEPAAETDSSPSKRSTRPPRSARLAKRARETETVSEAASEASAAASVDSTTTDVKAAATTKLTVAQSGAAGESSFGSRAIFRAGPQKPAVPPPVHGAAERVPFLTETDRLVVRGKLEQAGSLQDQICGAGAPTIAADIRQDAQTAVAIRLTAALIIRNLALAPSNRPKLMPYEWMLFDRASKDFNVQGIIASCLALLNSTQTDKKDSPIRDFGGFMAHTPQSRSNGRGRDLSMELDDESSGEPRSVEYRDVARVAPTKDRYGKSVYTCRTCGKGFATNFVMKRHARMHTNLKAFVCPVCGKEFNRKDAMKQHTQVHKKSEW